MKLHHIGIACENIPNAIIEITKYHKLCSKSEILFDPLQNANVCMLHIDGSVDIELVQGEAVSSFITEQKNTIYHLCYEVENLEQTISDFLEDGAIELSSIKPAILFSNRRVAFIKTDIGILELLESKIHPSKTSLPSHQIKIMSTFTDALLKDKISVISRLVGEEIKPVLSPYNQVIQELLIDHQENAFDMSFVLTRLSDWLRHREIDSSEGVYEELVSNLVIAAKQFSEKTYSELVIILCPDHLISGDEFEKEIIDGCRGSGVAVIPSEFIVRSGFDQKDFEQYANSLGHIPFTEYGFDLIACTIVRYYNYTRRKPYKVIAVDCDNTLWTGICGETSKGNIKVLKHNKDLQTFLINQVSKGMLLCLTSKNNENDIWDIINHHPNMIISREHIVAARINWRCKADNLKELSQTLGLELDSFIFIDDNANEIADMQVALPQVLAIQVSQDINNQFAFLNDIWAFDHFNQTSLDKNRTKLYQDDMVRKAELNKCTDYKGFIMSLSVKVSLNKLQPKDLSRASQLTKRITQFNCSNAKWSETEIIELENEGVYFFLIYVEDKFGEYGNSGLIAYSCVGDACHVHNFLLSCRVLGKQVEQRVFNILAKQFEKDSIKRVFVNFNKTSRNRPAEEFLLLYSPAEENDGFSFSLDSIVRGQKKNIVEKKRTKDTKPVSIDMDRVLLNRGLIRLAKMMVAKKYQIQENTDAFNESTIEEKLHKLFIELLNNNIISFTSDFFKVGGNSLSAIQLISRIQEKLGYRLSLDDIYNNSSVSALSKLLKKGSPQSLFETPKDSIHKDNKKNSLLPRQMQLWLHSQLMPDSFAYNMPLTLSVEGSLNIEALEAAFSLLVENHQAFQLAFSEHNGRPYQLLQDVVQFELDTINVENFSDDEIAEYISITEQHRFDLAKAPLLLVRLLRLSPRESILIIVIHHIVFDGFSYDIMNSSLEKYYDFYKNYNHNHNQLTLPSSKYLNDLVEHEMDTPSDKTVRFWKTYLNNTPCLSLPTDFPKDRFLSSHGTYSALNLKDDAMLAIDSLAENLEVSKYSILLTIFMIEIFYQSKQNHFPVAVVTAGRERVGQEDIIGYYANTLLAVFKIDKKITLEDIIRNNHRDILNILTYQNIALDDIVSQCSDSNSSFDKSLMDAAFVFQNTRNSLLKLSGVNITKFRQGYNIARFHLVLELEEVCGKLRGGIYFRTSLYSKKSIARITGHFSELLEKLIHCDLGLTPQLILSDNHDKH